MRRVSAKFVPRVLTVEQKQQRLSISLELHDCVISDSSFLGNVIKGDETWVYGTASESGKNDGISVFEARRSILRGINGNVSFTVIFFFI